MQVNTMKTQYENRISHLEKENADMRAEKQQEKERMMRDIEALNQRLNQLQRQLDKQQVMWSVIHSSHGVFGQQFSTLFK
jgi:flagellar motility protein MotE (MotC chaperone)